MSAITGIYQINEEPINLQHGQDLMTALQKYPADDVGTWHDENIFFGCHAQWITTESINETLPYYHYEAQLAITADAIIDNRKELFDKLQIQNDDRKQMPDSKLILLAYVKWGEECPKHLIGDFTFMIWDQKNRKLFGARDFSGSRTLYFHKNKNSFNFCTTIEPLLTLPYIEKKMNEQWLAEYLAIPTNFESVDLDSTVYTSIEQVPPSHSITVVDGRIRFNRYSTIKSDKPLRLKSNEEYEEAFREVFQTAVSARLRTNYKVGAHLSGGLDSGSVVSFAARELRTQNKPLHTFSYIPVDDFVDWTPKSRVADERPFIQSTVQHVGNIHDHYFNFREKNPLTEVDDWIDVLEMPYKFYENSFWLKGIYEQASQEGVRVLLNGQRGNWTISWGHAFDYQIMLLKQFKLVQFIRELHLYSRKIEVKRSKVIAAMRKKLFANINSKFSAKTDDLYPLLINPEFAKKTNVYNKLKEHEIDITGSKLPNAFEMRETQFEKLYYWSINGTYATKLSLRHSIVERDPTNDLRVIQFCQSVPESQFVQNGQDRSLIRRATKGFLPDKVRLNQRTRGIQGADGIHRMLPSWNLFILEIEQLIEDDMMNQYLNMDEIRGALALFKNNPQPEMVYDHQFRILMRSLIVYRYLKKFYLKGGANHENRLEITGVTST